MTQARCERDKSKWSIRQSEISKTIINPVRVAIVRLNSINLNPEKERIFLAAGDSAIDRFPVEEVVQAVIRATASRLHNGYVPAAGSETARAAVAAYSSHAEAPLTAKDVVLTSGSSGAIELCISALGNRGQNLLVPRLGFPLYKMIADSLGIEARSYNLLPETDWEVDLDQLESLVDGNTIAIIMCNPSNFCGSVYDREHLQEILEIAERNKLPIIADEVYENCVFPPAEYVPLATLSTQVPILTCGSLSKKFMLPGWRLGWVCIHDRNDLFLETRVALQNLATKILGPNTLIQGALETILSRTHDSLYRSYWSELQTNAQMAYSIFSQAPGLRPTMPKGAMYMVVGIDIACFPAFPDGGHFTEALASEQSVLCLPLKFFEYSNFFRIALAVSSDKVATACERISDFCTQHFQQLNY